MSDAPFAPDTAVAASTASPSPLRLLLPRGEGDGEVQGEEEGLKAVTDRGVAVGNQERPHLPPPPSSRSAPASLFCCSQSASMRLCIDAAGLRLPQWKLCLHTAGL